MAEWWDGTDVDDLLIHFRRQVCCDLAARQEAIAAETRAWLGSDDTARWLRLSFPSRDPNQVRALLVGDGEVRHGDRRLPH